MVVIPEQQFGEQVQKAVSAELEKVQLLQNKEAMRYRMPYIYNTQTNPDRKPSSDLPFSYLRRMAQLYPIARACINRRVSQITQLKWEVTTIDDVEGEKGYEAQIALVKQWLKSPMGHKTRFRKMLTTMIDDVLTLDAISFEIQKTRGGKFMYLIPVDPSTILLRVTETGGTPEPPEIAYEQVILGQIIGQFTTDRLLYDSMNSKSYTPYGFAPLESLIIQVEGALRGALYNLNYFKENNVPEGFITIPEDIANSKAKVEEWQEWFDAIVAGDTQMMHRLKILPGGSEYTPAKKPEDMAFERFEMWILEQTCAVFDVPPQDIGITYQVNKSTGEVQQDLGVQRGLLPLANFTKEIIDYIIQDVMGFPQLQIVPTNLNPVDEKQEVEIAEKEIKMGAMSVDEYRERKGLQPVGLKHYIIAGNEPILVDDFIAGKKTIEQTQATATTGANQQPSQQNNQSAKVELTTGTLDQESEERLMVADLRKWKKCIISDIKSGRKVRTDFDSEFIPEDVREYIQSNLLFTDTTEKVYTLFEKYLDPQLRASYTLLDYAQKIKGARNVQYQ